MGSPLLAFAAGLGGGYLDQKRQIEIDDERKADRAQRQQEFDARMDELKRAKTDRAALADAGRAAVVNPNAATLDMGNAQPAVYEDAGVANSDYRQARTMGLEDAQAPQQTATVNGKAYGSTAEADAAAATYNQPAARTARLADAYMATGRPDQALNMQDRQQKMTQEQLEYAKKLKEEGVFTAVRALRTGDASGIAKAFNAGGQYKIDGEPVVTREDRDIPGIGKVPTYTAKVRMIGPDGKAVDQSFNSHEVSMAIMPYEKQLELMRKGTESDSKAEYRTGVLDAKEIALEAKKVATEAKNAGQPSREERLRYTSLFTDSGRRLAEANKSLASLQRDPLWARAATKPGTPQSQQLQDLQEAIKTHKEERSMYQGLLAGSQSNIPTLSDGKPGATGPGIPTEAAARAAVNGGMGADPQAIAREIAASEASLKTVADPKSRAVLQGHIEDMKRQGANVGLSSGKPATSAKPNYSSLWK